MARVVRLDLALSLSTSERLDAAFARARELDDGSGSDVAVIVEFPLRDDGSVLIRLDRADLFLRDQSTAAMTEEELEALRRWMRINMEQVRQWRGSVRPLPPNAGETRWRDATTSRGVTDRERTVVVDGKEIVVPAGAPVSRRTVRWGRTQGTLPASEPDRPPA